MAEPLFRPLAELIAGHQAGVAVAVLSLDDCPERRAALLQRALPPAWVEHYWPAADLRHQPAEQASRFLSAEPNRLRYRRPWRSSEVGCALSHRSALLAFLATPARLLLVLEDDVIPTCTALLPALRQVVMPLLEARPQALFCHLGPRPEHLDPADLRALRLAQPGQLPPLRLHQNRNRPLWRAHAYLISREAARRCLALEPDGLQLLADDWQARRQAGALGRLLVAAPALFVQDDDAPSTQHEPIPSALSTTPSALAPGRIQAAVQHRWQALSDRLLRRLPHVLR
jgi:glycosyl transferase family 25